MGKDALSFNHYSNTRYSIEMRVLRKHYGSTGYGLYWVIIEILAETATHQLALNEAIFEAIATETDLPKEYVSSFINDCINRFRLFSSDSTYFWCSLLKRREFVGKRLSHKDARLWRHLRQKVFKRDEYTCQYCGKTNEPLEADHIVPISKGGTDDLTNLTTACGKCNRQKKDKSVDEFMAWRLANG